MQKKGGQRLIEYGGGEAYVRHRMADAHRNDYALQPQSGSFPKPLTTQEERYDLDLASKGDLKARNILIERNQQPQHQIKGAAVMYFAVACWNALLCKDSLQQPHLA